MKMSENPIFIHSLFRTGSTYIWYKFRQNPGYKCHYEPLHQIMSEIDSTNIDKALTRDYASVKHPELQKHYLEEYKDVLQENITIPFFQKEFSFDQFCEKGENKDLKRYIDYLISKAGGRRPLFKFNRTSLRCGWFKKNYPESLNIYLFRNPRDQFNSYCKLKERTGKDIFFVMDLLIASKNQKAGVFSKLSAQLELIEFSGNSSEEEIFFYTTALNLYSDRAKYFVFYYIWLVCIIENILWSDRLIDINRLSQSLSYRGMLLDFFQANEIRDIDLHDSRIPVYKNDALNRQAWDEIESFINRLVLSDLTAEKKSLLADFLKKEKRTIYSAIYQSLDQSGPLANPLNNQTIPLKENLLKMIGKKSFYYYKNLKRIEHKPAMDLMNQAWELEERKGFKLEKLKDDLENLKEKFSREKKANQDKFKQLSSQLKGKNYQINMNKIEYQKLYSELSDTKRELELHKLKYHSAKEKLLGKHREHTVLKSKYQNLFQIKRNLDHGYHSLKDAVEVLKRRNDNLTSEIKISRDRMTHTQQENSKLVEDVKKYNNHLQCVLAGRSYKIGRAVTAPWRWAMARKKNRPQQGIKMAFIDHSFHKKSLATEFLIDLLKKNFELSLYWDGSWNNGLKVNLFDLKNKGYDYIVFFQSYNYSREELKILKGTRLVLIPMYDGSAHYGIKFWMKYRMVKILNFSRTLHKKLHRFGLNTMHAQYFVNPGEFSKCRSSAGNHLRGFFWQRKDHVVWNDIKLLIGRAPFETIHIHKALDPPMGRYHFEMPSPEDIEHFHLTFTDWFCSKEEYLSNLRNHNVFFAPRLYEGIGMSFLEAMACGMCVVAPDNPTMNEYIVNGVTGLLYNPNQLQPLDFSKAAEIGKNARAGIARGYLEWQKREQDLIKFITQNWRRRVSFKICLLDGYGRVKAWIKKLINRYGKGFDFNKS